MKLSCPFCPAEIEPEANMCPSCRTTYDLDTLKFLRILVRESSKEHPGDRREELRIPTTLKVSYSNPKEFVDNYLYNLSLGGVFIKTNDLLSPGEKLSLRLFLPDNQRALEVPSEVVWIRSREETTPEGTLPAGMGVKFLNHTKEARQRIIGILSRALSETEVESAVC